MAYTVIEEIDAIPANRPGECWMVQAVDVNDQGRVEIRQMYTNADDELRATKTAVVIKSEEALDDMIKALLRAKELMVREPKEEKPVVSKARRKAAEVAKKAPAKKAAAKPRTKSAAAKQATAAFRTRA